MEGWTSNKKDPYLRIMPIITSKNYLMYQVKMLSCHCDKALTKRDWRVQSISCSPRERIQALLPAPTSGGPHACNSSSRGFLNICTHNHLHIIKIYLKQKNTNQKQPGSKGYPGLIYTSRSQFIDEGRQSSSLEVGTEATATEECRLLACSPWSAQPAILNNQEQPAGVVSSTVDWTPYANH